MVGSGPHKLFLNVSSPQTAASLSRFIMGGHPVPAQYITKIGAGGATTPDTGTLLLEVELWIPSHSSLLDANGFLGQVLVMLWPSFLL